MAAYQHVTVRVEKELADLMREITSNNPMIENSSVFKRHSLRLGVADALERGLVIDPEIESWARDYLNRCELAIGEPMSGVN